MAENTRIDPDGPHVENVAVYDISIDEAEELLSQKKPNNNSVSVMTEKEIKGLLEELDYGSIWSYPPSLKTGASSGQLYYPETRARVPEVDTYTDESSTLKYIEDTLTAVDETTTSIRNDLDDKSNTILDRIDTIESSYMILLDEVKNLRQELDDTRIEMRLGIRQVLDAFGILTETMRLCGAGK